MIHVKHGTAATSQTEVMSSAPHFRLNFVYQVHISDARVHSIYDCDVCRFIGGDILMSRSTCDNGSRGSLRNMSKVMRELGSREASVFLSLSASLLCSYTEEKIIGKY